MEMFYINYSPGQGDRGFMLDTLRKRKRELRNKTRREKRTIDTFFKADTPPTHTVLHLWTVY